MVCKGPARMAYVGPSGGSQEVSAPAENATRAKRPALRNQSPYKGHGLLTPPTSVASPSLLCTRHTSSRAKSQHQLSSRIHSFSSPQLLQISSLPQSFPHTALYKWQRHPHSTPVLPLPSEPCLFLYDTYGTPGTWGNQRLE